MDMSPSALLTDLYQLNMVQAYLEAGQTETTVFEFFVRKLRSQRNFLVAAGLEQAPESCKVCAFPLTPSWRPDCAILHAATTMSRASPTRRSCFESGSRRRR